MDSRCSSLLGAVGRVSAFLRRTIFIPNSTPNLHLIIIINPTVAIWHIVKAPLSSITGIIVRQDD